MAERDPVQELRQALAARVTPLPWRWWDSCSFRRLSSDATGKDGDVLSGTVQCSDGHADVLCSEADRDFIAAACNAAPLLLARNERLHRHNDQLRSLASATLQVDGARQRSSFQERVRDWMHDCFGIGTEATQPEERSHRFLEEALELAQANGCNAAEAHELVEYVFNRPPGELRQEVGGTLVTLAALCWSQRVSMEQCAEDELARCSGNTDRIRAKNRAKRAGTPLPGASDRG